MIATFWSKLFEYADRVKKECGKMSAEYKTVHEIEDILQKAYDENNQFENVVIGAKPKSETEAYIFEHLPEVKVYLDDDGYYYEIEGHHKDSASEVLDYIIREREHANIELRQAYTKASLNAINAFTKKMQKKMIDELDIMLQKSMAEKKNEMQKWSLSKLQEREAELNKREASLFKRENEVAKREVEIKEREEALGKDEE